MSRLATTEDLHGACEGQPQAEFEKAREVDEI
jgi:hypothetical protein